MRPQYRGAMAVDIYCLKDRLNAIKKNSYLADRIKKKQLFGW